MVEKMMWLHLVSENIPVMVRREDVTEVIRVPGLGIHDEQLILTVIWKNDHVVKYTVVGREDINSVLRQLSNF